MPPGTGPARVPPRNKKGSRTGFTTGACSAAAAKAAARCVVQRQMLSSIETTLPNRQTATFELERCDVDWGRNRALCSVIKDAGDDPDCTHGAELVAEVELLDRPGIEVVGGDGVATVTKPGLGLEVGTAAINPVPRRNIADMVAEEIDDSRWAGARVTVSVPDGERMALETTNARLGLLGGISILGTSGIVRPYSTAAFKASVVQAIDLLAAQGGDRVVLTTGGKSEQYAMKLFAGLPAEAFVQMGDFVGIAVRHAARRGLARADVVGMMGKLSKMADGRTQTHAAGSKVNMDMLADIADAAGLADEAVAEIRVSATARRALELCPEDRRAFMTMAICRRAVTHLAAYARAPIEVRTHLVDFGGALLGSSDRESPPEETCPT